jgi:hypothetical protein
MPKIGHIKVKVARNAYHVLEHIGNNSYKKIATLYKFADTLPYRNNKMMTHNGKLKYRDFPEPVAKVKPMPLPKTKPAPKVVNTTGGSVRSNYKALKVDDKLVIAEQNRPQKVRVVVNSKTSIMVYPNEVENAIARYNQRYRQSQEQSHNYNRKPVAKPKQKQLQSEQYFYN